MDDESGESMEPMEKVPLEIRRDSLRLAAGSTRAGRAYALHQIP